MTRDHSAADVRANTRPGDPGQAGRAEKARCVSSRQLFGGARELRIEHAGEVYLLRQTSSGKLLLTK